ncbi:MAG: hypothetical protein HYZ92_04320 [Candidatus Omnitrophica bacterium]|nr:hypothetical protein [Candidatus Omnitrophota bacterium]
MRWKSLGLIGLLGGLGGAINAWLCYAKLPVPIPSLIRIIGDESMQFDWTVVLGGAGHGALLATIPIGAAWYLTRVSPLVSWLAIPIIGWLSGWLAWAAIMLAISVTQGPSLRDLLQAVGWPFLGPQPFPDLLWTPYPYFGLVGGIYCFLLSVCAQLKRASAVHHVLSASLSGIIGSLLFWISSKVWWFSLLHGTIWGLLVGFGVWQAQRQAAGSDLTSGKKCGVEC